MKKAAPKRAEGYHDVSNTNSTQIKSSKFSDG